MFSFLEMVLYQITSLKCNWIYVIMYIIINLHNDNKICCICILYASMHCMYCSQHICLSALICFCHPLEIDEEDRQRKRKGEDPDKPAKRTSFCAEDEPNSPEFTEGAAAALQNLNLLREADEQQGGVPLEASEGCVKAPTDASVDSEQNQKEATNDQPSGRLSETSNCLTGFIYGVQMWI